MDITRIISPTEHKEIIEAAKDVGIYHECGTMMWRFEPVHHGVHYGADKEVVCPKCDLKYGEAKHG